MNSLFDKSIRIITIRCQSTNCKKYSLMHKKSILSVRKMTGCPAAHPDDYRIPRKKAGKK
jgi:hypothetical protein